MNTTINMSFYLEKALKSALEVGIRRTAVYGWIVKWGQEDGKSYHCCGQGVCDRMHQGSWQVSEVCACVHALYSSTPRFIWVQLPAFTWNFSWMIPCIIKHEIHIMLKVLPNISIALEESCDITAD